MCTGITAPPCSLSQLHAYESNLCSLWFSFKKDYKLNHNSRPCSGTFINDFLSLSPSLCKLDSEPLFMHNDRSFETISAAVDVFKAESERFSSVTKFLKLTTVHRIQASLEIKA